MTDPLFPDPETRNGLEPGCARCPALVESRERIAWGNGSREAAVMVVGEAPGTGAPGADLWRGGNWTGLAYTARHSGQLIRRLFASLGYGAADLYVSNAVKCYPAAENEPTTNREPTAEERRRCRSHLEAELEQVAPAAVATTGRHATASVLGLSGQRIEGFLELVCEPQSCPDLGVIVLPLLHPSYEAVWRSRLGYDDRATYIDAVGTALDRLS